MIRVIILIASVFLALSCSRYPDPSVEFVKFYSFQYETLSGMRFQAGDWVGDSVRFRAVNTNSSISGTVKVIFEVISGGGEITVGSGYTDAEGYISTKWRLGFGACKQILRANTYDLSGNYLSSTDLIEYGFRDNEWNEFTGYPDGNISGMIADTVNKVTFMIAGSKLFKPGEKYYLWSEVTDPVVKSSRTIDLDKTGVIYISTWSGELIKSVDHGVTWQTCSKPYPLRPYYFYINISNDNTLWAFAWDNKTRYSKDGGITWNDSESDITTLGYGNYHRLNDGSILFNMLTLCKLYRSFDEGLTWTQIVTPGLAVKFYVDENETIFLITQNWNIYRSTDFGATFTIVRNITPSFVSTDFNFRFYKWGNLYYVFIPGYGVLKCTNLSDFHSYEEYFVNNKLNYLFIDHNGVLIGREFNGNTVYYRNNSN